MTLEEIVNSAHILGASDQVNNHKQEHFLKSCTFLTLMFPMSKIEYLTAAVCAMCLLQGIQSLRHSQLVHRQVMQIVHTDEGST